MTLKKIAACVLVLVCAAACLCGCGYNPKTVLTIDGTDVPCGEYLYYQYRTCEKLISDGDYSTMNELLAADFDGVAAKDYINEKVTDRIAAAYYVQSEFASRGLELDATTSYYANYIINNSWSSEQDIMEKNGVGYESYCTCMMRDYMLATLFSNLYGEGGDFEVSLSELEEYYDANYANIEYLTFPTSDVSGTSLTNELSEQLLSVANEIYDACVGGSSLSDAVLAHYAEAQQVLGYSESAFVSEDTVSNFVTTAAVTFGDTFTDEFVQQAIDSNVGTFYLYTNNGAIIVYRRLANYASDDDFSTNYRATALQKYKYDEFTEYTVAQGRALEIAEDSRARSHYSLENVRYSASSLYGM